MNMIYIYSNADMQFQTAAERMYKAGIKVVGQKGCIVKELYTVPEFRTMSDFDIMIREGDLEKCRRVFEELGYTVSGTKREIICQKQGALMWEICTSMETEFKNTYQKADKEYMDTAVLWKYGQYRPSNTMLMSHITVHTAKHLLSNGAGIRNMLDVALCMREYDDIDYSRVRDFCKEEGCQKVYDMLINAAHYYFDADMENTGAEHFDEDKIDACAEYMLSETVFGKRCQDNRLLNWAVRNDDIPVWRKLFFPSLRLMKTPYPYLKKYPFLLPAAWVQRAYNAVVTQKISVKNMIKGVGTSIEYGKENEDRLKKLGLK